MAFATILRAQGMRYLTILTWALGLGAVTHWSTAVVWAAVSIGWGLVRGWADRRQAGQVQAGPAKAGYYLIALTNETIWSAAPVLGWISGHPFGEIYALLTCVSGIHISVRQLDETPVKAFVVTAPFSIILAIMLFSEIGQPLFWPAVCALPLVYLGFISHLVYGRILRGLIAAYRSRQTELVADLESARDRAEQASRAKSSFLALMGHELRTPMNGVLGAAQLLEARVVDPTDRALISTVRASGDTLSALLNDLLDLTDTGSIAVSEQEAPVELSSLLESITSPWAARAEAKGLGFMMRSHFEPTFARVDPARLGQIFDKLLSNAVKFTPQGGITVEVALRPQPDDTLVLQARIIDTGVGVNETDSVCIFEPFFQSDSGVDRQFDGSGLGLPSARKLVQQMGGSLEWERCPQPGAIFVLTVPLQPAETSANAPEDDIELGSQLRVLVVEDHSVNRMVLESMLHGLGHQTVAAENGQIGVDLAGAEVFDLVLMDVNMPVMDGLTATRRIRESPGPNWETPVIIVSALARPEDHEAGYAAGADGYLDKPVAVEALAALVRRISMKRPVSMKRSGSSQAWP